MDSPAPEGAYRNIAARPPSAPQVPIMDLTNLRPPEETIAGGMVLTAKVFFALKKLLGPRPSLRQALEVRWILLLTITTMRELGSPAIIDNDSWVDSILELAGSEQGLRRQTGVMIAAALRDAPWGLQKQPGASSFDTVETVNAISAGVVAFSRQLATELKKMEDMGIILAEFDVSEAGSDGDDSGGEEFHTPPKSKTKKTASRKARVDSAGPAGHGNHNHTRALPWTTAEHIGLLELYRANPDRKTVSHPQIAVLHNARFWNKVGGGRSSASVAQQYLKLVQHDWAQIPAKVTELQALLDEEE